MPKIALVVLCSLLLPAASVLRAQEVSALNIDAGVTLIAERSLRSATPDNFWMEGGSIELGANVWRGLGIAANVSGAHTSAVGRTNIPLSLVTVAFGPRYRWHANHRISIYGEGLVGEAHGFNSLFPAMTASRAKANGFAAQAGGGLDYHLSQHIAIRAVEAAWQHTQLPNGTNDVQTTLRLGAGLVLLFGR